MCVRKTLLFGIVLKYLTMSTLKRGVMNEYTYSEQNKKSSLYVLTKSSL